MIFFNANKTLRLGNHYFIGYHSQRERTQDHRGPSINGTQNVFNYFVTRAKQMDKEQTKRKKTTNTKKKRKNNVS